MNDLFIKPVHIITLLIILSLEYMNCQCRRAVCLSITSLKSLLRVFCVWNSLIENWSNKSKFNLLKSSVPFVLFCFVCLSVLFVCLFGLFLKEGGGVLLHRKVLCNNGMRVILFHLPMRFTWIILLLILFWIHMSIRFDGLNIVSNIGW